MGSLLYEDARARDPECENPGAYVYDMWVDMERWVYCIWGKECS